MTIPCNLVGDFRNQRLMLFAGAGVSTVLGLPRWSGLIAQMASELTFDPEIFNELGSYPTLAEYYTLEKGGITRIVNWMKREWSGSFINVSDSDIHRLIVTGRFPIIYTTNYDSWLEAAHDHYGAPYSKIVTGEDISKASGSETQIVKFHGDLSNPETMVISESDYFERLRFEAELDIKLQSDMLRYSTLFIGYSLSDVNVRNMLYRQSLFRKKYSRHNLRSYVFSDRHNQVQSRVLESWGVQTVMSEELDRSEGLTRFLRELIASR